MTCSTWRDIYFQFCLKYRQIEKWILIHVGIDDTNGQIKLFCWLLTLIRVGFLVHLKGGGKVPTELFELFVPHFIIQMNQTWFQMKAGIFI